jgi:hypothetical protein
VYVEFVKRYELEFEEFLLTLHTRTLGGIFVKWHYYCWLYLLGSRVPYSLQPLNLLLLGGASRVTAERCETCVFKGITCDNEITHGAWSVSS